MNVSGPHEHPEVLQVLKLNQNHLEPKVVIISSVISLEFAAHYDMKPDLFDGFSSNRGRLYHRPCKRRLFIV